MKIVAFIQMYNESSKGNLERCLVNCKQWADDIVIYDDASTDDSVEVAEKYTEHIIRGEVNNFYEELYALIAVYDVYWSSAAISVLCFLGGFLIASLIRIKPDAGLRDRVASLSLNRGTGPKRDGLMKRFYYIIIRELLL